VCRASGDTLRTISIQPNNRGKPKPWNTPARADDVRAAVARHFAGVAAAAGGLLDEASLIEQALAGLVEATRDPDHWDAWIDRLEADVAWDRSENRNALDPILGNGKPAALSRLVSLWGRQPWSPLYLDWEITVHRSQGAAKDFGPDWQATDYDYEPATNQPGDADGYTVHGRSLMAPVALQDLLKDNAGMAASTMPTNWEQAVAALEGDGLLGQTLGGFHQIFLGRNLLAPRIAPDPDYPWVPADQSQFGDAALGPAGLLASPNLIPQALAAGRPLTMRSLAPASPKGTHSTGPFTLLRAGWFTIDHLWMVDDFGQWVELAGESNVSTGIVASPRCRQPAPKDQQDRPRIVQPARLEFRFVDADDHATDSDLHPETHPVCGWVYINYLDQALAICDGSGRLLGEIVLIDDGGGEHATRWECLKKGKVPTTDVAALGVSATLVDFVKGLLDPTPHPRQKLQDLFDLVDAALANIRPTDESHRFRLTGRPLALVNARVGLELFGAAWQDPSPDNGTGPPAADAGTGDATLDKLRLPVQLGYAGLARDGLIGFYARGDGQAGMSRIIPAAGHSLQQKPSGYVSSEDVPVGFDAPAAVTLLMDPNAAVHACVRILPAKAITLPAAFVEQARTQMELSVRVGPTLVQNSRPGALPVPQGLMGQWCFRSPVTPDGVPVAAPDTRSGLGGALPLAVEGRLVLEATSESERKPRRTTGGAP
jgi:hypothetical protein